MTFKLPVPDCYDATQDVNCYSAELVKEAYKMGMDAKPECTCAAKDMPFGKCCKATRPTTRDEKISNPGVYVTDAAEIRAMFEKDDYEGTPV